MQIPINKNAFSVYPNPFKDELNIRFYQPNESVMKVAVYDTKGRCVQLLLLGNDAVGEQNATIRLALGSGTYVLKVLAGNKDYQTVIIQK